MRKIVRQGQKSTGSATNDFGSMKYISSVYSQVNAVIFMPKKPEYRFAAKGFIRHFDQKMALAKKKMKTSQTFHISSLMYFQSFWLRNMHLKMTCSMGAYFKLYKGNRYSLWGNMVLQGQKSIGGATNDFGSMKYISSFTLK